MRERQGQLSQNPWVMSVSNFGKEKDQRGGS